MKVVVSALGALLWGTLAFAGSPVSLRVSPEGFGPSGTNITAYIRVEPNPANRAVFIVMDGPKYRDSGMEIGPETKFIDPILFRDLPDGRYVLQAFVRRVVEGEIEDHPSEPRTVVIGSLDAER